MRLEELPRAEDAALDFQALEFDYVRSADQQGEPADHPVVVVGAGPVGLSLAIDLAQRGIRVVLLDNDSRLSSGSRAICFAKRTLEIFDRLGAGDRMVAKGVSWNVGRVFLQEQEVYAFNLLQETGHERPAFINLQQYYVEGFLLERAAQLPLIDIRWRNQVVGVEQLEDRVRLTVDTPEGRYQLGCAYVAACDGSRSTVRSLLGLESSGRVFQDRFLIADVQMKLQQPAERWFWFDPPFHRNQSVLLHMQPDNVWRIDFQLGWDADPEVEKRPENIVPRIRKMLSYTAMKDVEFELKWASVYTFSCLRMATFRHGRILFAGDSAHGVSPFGARGANSGVQDVDNLGWKLAAVLRGTAPDELLDTYASEREFAADENILNSTRATDFITPKSGISRLFRDAVLELSREHAFARTLVNSGRLSTPSVLHSSDLNTPEAEEFDRPIRMGAPATDAPVQLSNGMRSWLLRQLGQNFTLLLGASGPSFATSTDWVRDTVDLAPLKVLAISPRGQTGGEVVDVEGLIEQRYGIADGAAILLRPDGHVCARWQQMDASALRAAIKRAMGHVEEQQCI
ncbi:MAG: monooxygenase, FAD-binding protein [Ramlibacter sp.]|nr:monooxygenase, FAD-binding protein [Ramlibacter sp.]